MVARCELCVPLNIETLRFDSSYKLHTSLFDLKSCADSRSCDACLLFWTCLKESCAKKDVEHYLRGRQSDPECLRDTTIFLWTFLLDMHPGTSPTSPKGAGGSQIQISAGDVKNSRVYGAVSIFATPDSFAAQYVVERDSSISRDPQLRTSISHQWLSTCRRSHEHCGGTIPMEMPTRVIDLGDPSKRTSPKLFLTKGRADRYVALSYSWGDGVRHEIKLKGDKLEIFQQAIPESSMTLAHREALQITRELGYRYIWIDALCIIQGDPEDWAREAIKIADVYGNAELTIVAGRSDNSLKGFLNHTYEPSIPPCSLAYSRPDTATPNDACCYVGLQRSSATGPADKRAWCFQESVLSRRMIVYGEQQLAFKCRERSDYEDGSYLIYRWGSGGRYDLSTDALKDQHLTKGDILKRWYELSMLYSIRDLYDPTDNFATLSGVAFRFQRALDSRYLAGLWESDMVRGLLWRSRRILLGPHASDALQKPIAVSGDQKGREIVRAPSWSWLALKGSIWQATERSNDRVLQDPSTLRCRPANQDGYTWSPDDWNPGIVKDLPLPCRLEVLGSPREVRRSSTLTSQFFRKPKWQYSRAKLDQHAILLEAVENVAVAKLDTGSQDQIVATGLFDLADGNPLTLWAMCLSSDEGLMLEKTPDGSFCRIGVFIVENEAWFEQGAHIQVVLV